LIESLLEVVGARGAVLALTHSPVQTLLRRNRSYVYHPATAPCPLGRFPNAVLQWQGAYRSFHPTCSLAGVGAHVRDLLRGHDHRSTCFAPMEDLIRAGGKMLVIGCTLSCPGCSTVHYVYEQLGLATKSLLSGWFGCYFRNGDRVQWFRQRDVPGCSMGFHKFYALYQQHALWRTGQVGTADAFLINAADAYRVEREAVVQNPKIGLCDSPHCFSCRGTRLYNLSDIPRYYLTCAPTKLLKLLRRAA
jgi:aminoglycoside N3'-acetyltransferase